MCVRDRQTGRQIQAEKREGSALVCLPPILRERASNARTRAHLLFLSPFSRSRTQRAAHSCSLLVASTASTAQRTARAVQDVVHQRSANLSCACVCVVYACVCVCARACVCALASRSLLLLSSFLFIECIQCKTRWRGCVPPSTNFASTSRPLLCLSAILFWGSGCAVS